MLFRVQSTSKESSSSPTTKPIDCVGQKFYHTFDTMRLFRKDPDPEIGTTAVYVEQGHSSGMFENLDPVNDAPMPQLKNDEERVHESLKKIKYWMDDRFKLGGRQFGLDPIVGLVPFVGDFASSLVSLAFVARAAPVLSKYTVTRMLVNVWIDGCIGAIPLLGDVFDVGWKANERNLAIFEDHMKVGGQARRNTDRLWVIKVALFCVAIYAITTIMVLVGIVFLVLYLTGSL